MTETKAFHVGDILTITTGRLVSPRHVDGIYDICNFMTGDNLFTHQLPRAMDECAPSLRKQFPDLARIKVPEWVNSETAVTEWLASVVIGWGRTREVAPLDPADHTRMDPFTELERIAPGKPVIVVEVPGPGSPDQDEADA
jgi:hypothetical protein